MGQGFGLLMLPLGTGVAQLLADAYRKAGGFLVWASSAAIGAAVLQSLVFRSLRDYQEEDQQRGRTQQDETTQSLVEIKNEWEQWKAKMGKD